MRPSRVVIAAALILPSIAACDGSAAPDPSTSVASTTDGPGGEVVVSPEFIQGVIPGAEVMLLVTQADADAGTASVTARAPGAAVDVEPSTISGTQLAEVTVVPRIGATETELTITIEMATDDAIHSVSRNTTVVPWDDDRAQQASEILVLFTSWLAEHRPELGLGPETHFEGTFLAPELLVVSHYGFLTDQWEIGLSWHVMIPPDDFTEIYLRPRAELRPTLAFRIDSWQTALDSGDYQVVEVAPPLEVVR